MSATDRPLALRLAADLRRREFLARACNSAASAANPGDWRVLAAAELTRLAAVEQERDELRSEVERLRSTAAVAPEGLTPTGWPEGMLQDDNRGMSKWLASQPDAMQRARAAAAAVAPATVAQAEPVAFFDPVNQTLRRNPLHTVQVATSAWRGEVALYQAAQPLTQKVVAEIIDRASRLVEHADFRLGGALSADSKASEIPSKACSQVKARHLASLRDALRAHGASQEGGAA